MVLRPLEVLVNSLVEQVREVLPDANVSPGSVIRDAFINAPASQLAMLYEQMDSIRTAQTVAEASGADLDRLAGNYGVSRNPGRPSIGRVTLILNDTIKSNDITISQGTTVSTNEQSNSISYTVIGSYLFRSIDQDFYAAEARRLSTSLQAYGITDAAYVAVVPVESISFGTYGNVGAGAITRGAIVGVRKIVNLTPTVGGTDIESDESLRKRITAIVSGQSAGTAEALESQAYTNPSVTNVAVIRPGDPLMTRDGSQYDEDGNLIKAGTGRDVDVYVRGQDIINATESYTFVDNSGGEPVSTGNNYALGYGNVDATNLFAQQPVKAITQLSGSVTGGNFRAAQEVTDEDGNVILEGNYVLLQDYLAANFTIVKSNETGETKVAVYLNPASSRYSVIQELIPSDYANSALGKDSIFWITNVATIENEVVTRGSEYNGADALVYQDVAQLQTVKEDVILTRESIVITNQQREELFVIYTKHTPIIQVTEVRHSRLGQNYTYEVEDPITGKIRLVGRFPPQVGDVIQISYTWRQEHLQNIEYFLHGDTIKWLQEPYEMPTTAGTTLLEPTLLGDLTDLQVQPTTPAFLGVEMSQLTARGRYDLTLTGDKARVELNKSVLLKSSPLEGFVFQVPITQSATATSSRLGRVAAVRNLTQGFSYSIENMGLNTNKYDAAVQVVPALADNEFLLDSELNTQRLDAGDKVLLSRKSLVHLWTTTEDFQNNINGNTAPTYDLLTTNIANDEVTVKRHEDDTTSAVTTLTGSISTSGSLSGIVDIAGDVVIEHGTTVVIEPNTVIRVRDSSALPSVRTVQDSVELNNAASETAIDTNDAIIENIYIFQQPSGVTSPFFVILDDTGTKSMAIYYSKDVVKKVMVTTSPRDYSYYINESLVADEFLGVPGGMGLIAAIATAGTFVGYNRDNGDTTITFVAPSTILEGRAQYGILLTETPRVTGIVNDSITFYQSSNPDAVFTDIAYDDGRNLLLVDGLAVESSYTAEYMVSTVTRLSIRVKGILEVSSETTDTTPVVFTSSAASPAPGDWEGIIFDPESRSGTPGNPSTQCYLHHAIIKNARIGIFNDTSDPIIEGVIVKDCKDGGYSIMSSFYKVTGLTRSDLRLLSNDFNITGRSYSEVRDLGCNQDYGYGYGYDYGCGYGYGPEATSTRTLSFVLNYLLVTADGQMPPFIKVGSQILIGSDILSVTNFVSKYIVNLVSGVDYDVYVDGTRIVPGVDANFLLEYDINRGGFLLSFFNTQLTLDFMADISTDPGIITIDLYTVYDNGLVRNCIFTDNGNAAIDIHKTALVTMENNTLDKNGFYGVTIEDSYAVFNNNLVTGYSIAPILQSASSVVAARTNNMWSLPVISTEQTEIADIDKLVLAIDAADTILTVDTSTLYSRNDIIKIDDEYMQVLDVLGDNISVTRGFNNTTPVAHAAGVDILLQRTKVLFTITGVPAEVCTIREVNSAGALISGREPVVMRLLATGTFQTSFTVDRSSTFYYRFQYKTHDDDTLWILTETRALPGYQFGNAMNCLFNVDHEVAIVAGNIDGTNYSDNPLYELEAAQDYRVLDTSPSSMSNTIYATPYDPNEPRLRYLGRASIVQVINLTIGVTSIDMFSVPIITTSVQNDVIVRLASNRTRTLALSSYNPTTRKLMLAEAVKSSQVGTYEVVYVTPVTLGTNLTPYPYITTLNYIYDEGRVVDFTKLDWAKSGIGGNIKTRFRVANRIEDISSATYSPYRNVAPADLRQSGIYPRGSVCEIEITVETNDEGFEPDGTAVFPKLLDFSLFLTPARDTTLYKVLDLDYDERDRVTIVTIEDDENPGMGIRNTTFETVGDGDVLSVIVRKAVDQFREADEFVIGECEAIAINDTTLRMSGDLTIVRTAPATGDEIVADYVIADLGDNELMTFLENGTQVTQSRFFNVTTIACAITIDRVAASPAGELLGIQSLAQPAPGTQYLGTYTFAAPSVDEVITVTFNYNDVIRSVAATLEANRVLTSDVLAREGFEVPIRITAGLQISTGFNPNAVIIDATNALGIYFASLTGFGGTISITNVRGILEGVTGVTSVTLNVLSRTAEASVSDIALSAREYASLAPNYPVLTVSSIANPGTVLATNSL